LVNIPTALELDPDPDLAVKIPDPDSGTGKRSGSDRNPNNVFSYVFLSFSCPSFSSFFHACPYLAAEKL
jgi:hypothetical protein